MADIGVKFAKTHDDMPSGETPIPVFKAVDLGDGTFALSVATSETGGMGDSLTTIVQQQETIITLLTSLNATINSGINVTVIGGAI